MHIDIHDKNHRLHTLVCGVPGMYRLPRQQSRTGTGQTGWTTAVRFTFERWPGTISVGMVGTGAKRLVVSNKATAAVPVDLNELLVSNMHEMTTVDRIVSVINKLLLNTADRQAMENARTLIDETNLFQRLDVIVYARLMNLHRKYLTTVTLYTRNIFTAAYHVEKTRELLNNITISGEDANRSVLQQLIIARVRFILAELDSQIDLQQFNISTTLSVSPVALVVGGDVDENEKLNARYATDMAKSDQQKYWTMSERYKAFFSNTQKLFMYASETVETQNSWIHYEGSALSNSRGGRQEKRNRWYRGTKNQSWTT